MIFGKNRGEGLNWNGNENLEYNDLFILSKKISYSNPNSHSNLPSHYLHPSTFTLTSTFIFTFILILTFPSQ